MKKLQNKDLNKSGQKTQNKFVSLMGVKTIALTFLLVAFMASCSKDDGDIQQEAEVPEQAARIYYDYIIVRAWGSHNVDCSQPLGFCHDVWRITWRTYNIALPNGDTPVRVRNVDGLFVMKMYKSALTEEHARTLLKNGDYYVIPKGQTIPEEVAKYLGLKSNVLQEGKYRIKEDSEFYTIAVPVARS